MRVPFSATGLTEGLSVVGAAQIIQDNICSFFAEFGKDDVSISKNYNAVWVFVKNKFRKIAVAPWNDVISVQSFITKINMASVIVDTVIKNSKGEKALYARTEVCVIDLSSQRVRRISSVEFPADIPVYAPEAEFDFERFDTEGCTPVYNSAATSTSIDFCKHVNNVEYFRFILNAFNSDTEITNPITEAEIHYLNQSREGEMLTVSAKNSESGQVLSVSCGEKTCARCKIKRKN